MKHPARWYVLLVVITTGVVVAVLYATLVNEGKIDPIDTEELFRTLAMGFTGISAVVIGIVVGLLVIFAALAPIIFAARSGDAFTTMVCIVLTLTTWGLVFLTRTVIDLTLAAVLYLASLTLSAVVFGASRIVDAIRANSRSREP